ncbi:MAG TPA: hypothetical protein VFK17_06450 [Gaiellaceae bacterium]|nr:hypothetical protein [Gaiellaceae bacterium]
MPEESHLDEMNAAIRAQRERQAMPRSMISTEDARPPEPPQPAPAAPAPAAPEPAPKRGLLSRLLGR